MKKIVPVTVWLITAVGFFLAGIYFQRQIGVGTFLKRIGIIRPEAIAADLSPRFRTLGAMPIRNGSIVFIGDSLIEQHEWHEAFPGKLVANRGVSGARINDLADVFDLKPAKLVFCLVGANDIGLGIEVEEFAKRYERLVRSIPQGTGFYAISVPAIRRHGHVAVNQDRIRKCNAAIQRISEQNGFHFIDIYTDSLITQGRYFDRDGLHLSAYGYEQLNRKLSDVIENGNY